MPSFCSIDWTDSFGNDQSIDIDCVSTSGIENVSEVTDHAVESGANVADHVRPKNESVSLECLISNTPIESPTFGMDGATGGVQGQTIDVGGRSVTAALWTFDQPFDRVQRCDTTLRDLQKSGQVLTVTTSVRRIPNCVIVRYRWERTADTGNALSFTLELQAVRIANSTTVPVTAARRRSQQTQQNRGPQPATPDNRSAAARAFDSLSGLFGSGT